MPLMHAKYTVSGVNSYVAHKQHLLNASRLRDVVQVTRDVVALHATNTTGPYLSLWARVPGFQRQKLEDALYERRELVKMLCMRTTLHILPADEVPFFVQAYAERWGAAESQRGEALLVQAGLCSEEEAAAVLQKLQGQVAGVLTERGPSTVSELSQALPALNAKVRHDVGKPYEGSFSVGSRLVPGLCTLGTLIRARPRGGWRSNLYAYAPLPDWLPGIDLDAVTPQEAQAWLVRRYLSAFGPVSLEDVQWWTGFSKGETQAALEALASVVTHVNIEGLGEGYWMLVEDARRWSDFTLPDVPTVFLLPGLDPYIMGYKERDRFLALEHYSKVFDRAGNAMPTAWVDGRVVGAWGQRKDGSVVYGLFEPVPGEAQPLLAEEARRLEAFLDGEFLPLRSHTSFTRALK
jgi:uncharacterized protein YcaQ